MCRISDSVAVIKQYQALGRWFDHHSANLATQSSGSQTVGEVRIVLRTANRSMLCDSAYARDTAARPGDLRSARRAGGGGGRATRRASPATRPSRCASTVVRRSLDARKGHPIGFRLEVAHLAGGRRATEDDERGAAAAGARRAPARTWSSSAADRAGPSRRCASADAGARGDARRARQAGAAAPPRSRGAHARGALDPRLQLLLRRGRRRHVLRRQALHALQGQARRSRDVLASWCAHGAPTRDPRRRAPAHRLEPAAEGPRSRCASDLEARGVEVRFGDAVVDRARRGEAACVGVRLRRGGELVGRRGGARDRPLARATSTRCCAAPASRSSAKAVRDGRARIEHPQPLIDRIQYGARRRPPAAAGRRSISSRRRCRPTRRRGVSGSACARAAGSCLPSTEPDGARASTA